MTFTPEIEEGCKCPECDKGTMGYPPVHGCSCHINPPCSACVDNLLKCNECGFDEPEPEPQPPPSQSQIDSWAKYRADYEAARKKGHTFPNGGRIYDMSHDGSSGSTMVWRGRYEGPVAAADILNYLGDGTFGHRGPYLGNGRFTYTKITD